MKLIKLLLLLLLIAGCASNPGHITINQSKFDNSTEMSMTPAWCSEGRIRLTLFWTSKMQPNELVLKAGVNGAQNIAGADSLKINIDGKKYLFSSSSAPKIKHTPGVTVGTTYIPGSTFTYQSYIVTREFVDSMISGQRTIVRLDLGQEYLEDEFSTDAYTMARPAFRDFLTQVDAIKAK